MDVFTPLALGSAIVDCCCVVRVCRSGSCQSVALVSGWVCDKCAMFHRATCWGIAGCNGDISSVWSGCKLDCQRADVGITFLYNRAACRCLVGYKWNGEE